MRPTPNDRLPYLVKEKMEIHGWCVVNALHAGEKFAYTVGLAKWGDHELLIRDLPDSEAQRLLNAVGRAVRHGHAPVDGAHMHGPESIVVRTEAASPEWSSRAALAHRFLDTPTFRVVIQQLTIIDPSGPATW